MIWLVLTILVIGWIIDAWKRAAMKRARRCQHGAFNTCPQCQEEPAERARAAAVALAKDEAQALTRQMELDATFSSIDANERDEIIGLLNGRRVREHLPDWQGEQLKRAVVNIYRKRKDSRTKSLAVSGTSVRKP